MAYAAYDMQLSWLKQNLNGAYQYCLLFNPHTPVAQKVADEIVFRRFQGEGVEFFLIGPH